MEMARGCLTLIVLSTAISLALANGDDHPGNTNRMGIEKLGQDMKNRNTSAAGIDPERNRQYIEFLEHDVIHSACYKTFCDCGSEQLSGFVSQIHERACDTNRVYVAIEIVDACINENGKVASTSCGHRLGEFIDLAEIVASRTEFNETSCRIWTGMCYGWLLEERVLGGHRPVGAKGGTESSYGCQQPAAEAQPNTQAPAPASATGQPATKPAAKKRNVRETHVKNVRVN